MIFTIYKVYIKQTADGYSIDSGSVDLDGVNGNVQYKSQANDNCPGIGYRQAIVTIPALNIGDITNIRWNSRPCIEDCDQKQNTWAFNHSYEKECAPPKHRFVYSLDRKIGSKKAPAFEGTVTLESDHVPLNKGNNATLVQDLHHPLLNSGQGSLHLRIRMPCELEPVDDDYVLNGNTPTNIAVSNNPSFNILEITYDLPFDLDDLSLPIPVQLTCGMVCGVNSFYDKYITSCPETCSGNIQMDKIHWQIGLNPDDQCVKGKEITYCDEFIFSFKCVDKPCEVVVPGYLDYTLDVYRTNYGLPDNDDDHIADTTGSIDTSKIALQNVIQGDTFVYDFQGVVVEDVPGKAAFSHGLLSMRAKIATISNYVISDETEDEYLDNFFNDKSRIKILETKLKIFDNNTGNIYDLNQIPISYDATDNDLDFKLTTLDLALLNPGFPADFQYSKGDSIRLYVTNLLDFNITKNGGPGDIDINFTHRGFLDTTTIDKDLSFHCHCKNAPLGVRGFYISTPNSFLSKRKYCKASFKMFEMDLFIEVNQNRNDFPFEIRSPYKHTQLKVNLGSDLYLDSVVYFFYRGDNNGINITESPEKINLQKLDKHPIDEFVYPKFNFYGHGQICSNQFSDERFDLEFTLVPQNNPGYFDTLKVTVRKGVPFYEQPKTKVNPLNASPFTESSTDTLEWEYPIRIQSTTSLNTWLAIEQHPHYEIIEIESPAYPIQSVDNGIYQFGDVPEGDTLDLTIRAIARNCKEFEVPISYGSHCNLIDHRLEPSCVESSDHLYGKILEGKAETYVSSDELTIPLCEETASLTSTIFNADRGHLKNLMTTMELPPGLEIVSGSGEIAYPQGSGQWRSIPDPIPAGDKVFSWSWESIAPDIFNAGLKSVNQQPYNGFDLRFDFSTNCDFISGSKFVYRTIGSQFCNKQSNSVAKVGGAVHIEGADPGFNSSIGLIEFEEVGCKKDGALAFSLSTSGTVDEKDSLYVQLPAQYTYKSFSAPLPPSLDGQLLSWPLEDALQPDSFTLAFETQQGFACGQDILSVYTASNVSAYCEEEMRYCDISVVNGRIDLPVVEERPEIFLDQLTVSQRLSPGLFNLMLKAENISNQNIDSLYIELYIDNDNIPGFSAGDEYLFTHLYSNNLTGGETVDISIDSINRPLGEVCQLIAHILADSNCLCRSDETYLEKPIELSADSTIHACPESMVDIGIESLPGFRYQWQEYNEVDCDTCPQTSFYAENSGQNPKTVVFHLDALNEDGCGYTYQIEVEIQPLPRILSHDQTICPGDTILLLSTEGASYNWSGNGESWRTMAMLSSQLHSSPVNIASK